MSKELTPLDYFIALGKVCLMQSKNYINNEVVLLKNGEIKTTKELADIIITALEEQEKYVQIAEKEHEELMYAQKKLKALEIIKKKDVFVWGFIHRQEEIEDFEWTYDYYKTHYGYVHSGGDYEILTEEEFDLLKEILK